MKANMAKNNNTEQVKENEKPAVQESMVLVRVVKDGTLINGAYGRRGAVAKVTVAQAEALSTAKLAVVIGA